MRDGYLKSRGYRIVEAGLIASFEYIALPLAVFLSVLTRGQWLAPLLRIGNRSLGILAPLQKV